MPAFPGVCQTVTVGATVTLDGSVSSAALYEWALTRMPGQSRSQLVGARTATPSFVADMAGIYCVTLRTDDGVMNTISVEATPA
jgi:hypothetical protein